MTWERIGFSGHQALSEWTRAAVSAELTKELTQRGPVVGLSSLAAGSDQIFARSILEAGGRLRAVIPCSGYIETFESSQDREEFCRLLGQAADVVQLEFDEPSEEAFFAAGKRVVEDSDLLIAVWDGKPAAGLGGTGDVVEFARNLGKAVVVIWPEGASR